MNNAIFGQFKKPQVGTLAGKDFFLTLTQITNFFTFVISMVGTVDGAAKIAHDVLFEFEAEPAKKERMKEEWEKRKSAAQGLSENRQFLLEVVLVRQVENFLNYLSSLLNEIFIQRPETLKSSEKIELSAVLNHNSIEDFVKTCAEKKVEALSYASFKELRNYFEERFSLTLVTEQEFPILNEAIEIRNISVHERCIINNRFISKTGCDPALKGKKKVLGIEYLEKIIDLITSLVIEIDKEALSELKLNGIELE
ncbi:MAG TPA: hypothetical protein VK859_05295 [bacterium]|jgi:hypothetical protein|nr:hypothetical protein [bacterium]